MIKYKTSQLLLGGQWPTNSWDVHWSIQQMSN